MERTSVGGKVGMVAAALLAVYVCWGGTYLAMKFAVETIPPLLMAGVRFVLAGAIMYGLAAARGERTPVRREWQGAALVGALLLAGGNGGVVLAARMVPSGLTALLVATSPLWMVAMNWLWLKDARPGAVTWAGVALGLAGIGLLAGGESILLGSSRVSPLWAAVLTAAAFLWALGSIATRKVALPGSAIMSTGMQMLTGGAAMIVLGLAAGEWAQLDVAAISAKSMAAFFYLVGFGSLVGFSAYVWLLQNSSPVLVSTYAYVNPVVAMLLGAVLGGEAIDTRSAVSMLVIVLSVFLLTARSPEKKKAAGGPERVTTDKKKCACDTCL